MVCKINIGLLLPDGAVMSIDDAEDYWKDAKDYWEEFYKTDIDLYAFADLLKDSQIGIQIDCHNFNGFIPMSKLMTRDKEDIGEKLKTTSKYVKDIRKFSHYAKGGKVK